MCCDETLRSQQKEKSRKGQALGFQVVVETLLNLVEPVTLQFNWHHRPLFGSFWTCGSVMFSGSPKVSQSGGLFVGFREMQQEVLNLRDIEDLSEANISWLDELRINHHEIISNPNEMS